VILTGNAIYAAVLNGDIRIDPFSPAQLSTNSYDFRLGDKCRVYSNYELDVARENPTDNLPFPEEGIVLQPDRLYLFNTAEIMGSTRYVPIIRGRSSVGRLGIFIHITADLIDIGSVNQWTLQLHSIVPTRVRPGMLIGQVTFWTVQGKVSLYAGKYADLESPAPSLSYLDYLKER
jgi:dCTP deaminase